MHDGRPVLFEFDGYLYLRYARDLIEGNYTEHDNLRNYPSGSPRPVFPPLLSSLIAGIAKITGLELEIIGAWLPVFVSAIVVLPLYWLGFMISGSAGGLAAAFIGTLSPFFVARSQFAFLDTDCAIPAFLILIHCLVFQVFRSTLISRSIYLVLLAVTTLAFAAWCILLQALSLQCHWRLSILVHYSKAAESK